MKSGHVILLNGTSSSGKTTIAKALQDKLPEPYMYVSIDDFFNLYPERLLAPTNKEEVETLQRLLPAVVSGLHRSVASLAHAGNNVIVDHVLQEQGWLQECIEQWVGFDVLFVGVRCPLEVAEQREKERGDRNIGTARYQFERVHSHGVYDVEIDTSILDVDECVHKIMALIKNEPTDYVFQDMRTKVINKGAMIPEPGVGTRRIY